MRKLKQLIADQKPAARSQQLTIGWLYPELMNTYGDRGNITILAKRCQWRGIKAEVKHFDPGFSISELKKCDLLLMGGAQDKQQEIVNKDLKRIKAPLSEMIEKATPGLYVCGGFQFLGKYYKEADGKVIDGLGIFDLYTQNPGSDHKRLIGNIAISVGNETIVGFENHGGRTYLGKNIEPFGKVLVGFGNNEKDKTEGAIYKNSIGTYLHGPVLPKNPPLSDMLIKKALDKKYKESITLSELDDQLAWTAHNAVAKKLGVAI